MEQELEFITAQHANDMEEFIQIQQKILITTILLIIKNGKKQENYNRTFAWYLQENLQESECSSHRPIGIPQLMHACGNQRDYSHAMEERTKIPSLEWDENEIYEALEDKQMITSILANKSVLNTMK